MAMYNSLIARMSNDLIIDNIITPGVELLQNLPKVLAKLAIVIVDICMRGLVGYNMW